MPEIFYPVKPFRITQSFGENDPCVKNFGKPNQTILSGYATCPIGYEKLYPKFGMDGHNGTDVATGEQPVYAAMAGTVIEKQTVPARGLGLGILSEGIYPFKEGNYFLKLRYWHLKSFTVEVGQTVKVGDQIGVTNNTGYSSGNHLHFEGQLMSKDAGGHPKLVKLPTKYANSINIEPYFNGLFAADIFRFKRDLWFGKQDVDNIQLQRRLGVIPTSINFGPMTFAAVVKYQQAHGITPTGYVGPKTRASLNSL